jgi:23S rRNA pseudouridine1911/1915/1917 synthase
MNFNLGSSINSTNSSTLNNGWCYQEQVPDKATGMTVGDYYSCYYPHSQPAEWHARIVAGQIHVNQQPTTPETVLQSGEWLSYHRPPWQEADVPLEFTILYEDEDLWVINKPAGLPVLPGGGFLQHTLLWQLQHRYPATATQDAPTPIHRLGRGTSGVMLLARTSLARSRLSQQMRQQTQQVAAVTTPDTPNSKTISKAIKSSAGLVKVYRALIGPGDLPTQFSCHQPIGKIPHPSLGYIYGACEQGKPALSQGRVLQRRPHATLVEVTIATGRPHQIRIHLAAMGYPLLGDPLYGVGGLPQAAPQGDNLKRDAAIPVPGDCGYFLHAHQLSFCHPRTGEPLQISSIPPPELQMQ